MSSGFDHLPEVPSSTVASAAKTKRWPIVLTITLSVCLATAALVIPLAVVFTRSSSTTSVTEITTSVTTETSTTSTSSTSTTSTSSTSTTSTSTSTSTTSTSSTSTTATTSTSSTTSTTTTTTTTPGCHMCSSSSYAGSCSSCTLSGSGCSLSCFCNPIMGAAIYSTVNMLPGFGNGCNVGNNNGNLQCDNYCT